MTFPVSRVNCCLHAREGTSGTRSLGAAPWFIDTRKQIGFSTLVADAKASLSEDFILLFSRLICRQVYHHETLQYLSSSILCTSAYLMLIKFS